MIFLVNFEETKSKLNLQMETLDSTNNAISQAAIKAMKGTAPWMKFIAITFFVLSLFMVIGSFGAIFISFKIGLLYLAITGIMIYTNVLLLGMGNSLGSYSSSPSGEFLDQFFKKCKTYFMIWGIFLIIYIVLILVVVITGGAIFQEFASMMQGMR